MRKLAPFLLAVPLVVLVVAAFGDSTAATVLGLVIAGVLGGAGAWFALGRSMPKPLADLELVLMARTKASGIEVLDVAVAENGHTRRLARESATEAETHGTLVHVSG
jgi:hypothetical protein